ncbi:hypothetical protein B4110_3318 [Parageobacillus toebii]|uniref:Uncharacterized protein n=1 Tax=Parageobacillus toebii TaxID=153151 RepID=A0A150N8G6_9BACL|nr:hypothetical protein B4110_3318 [Parageobacillus toebii]
MQATFVGETNPYPHGCPRNIYFDSGHAIGSLFFYKWNYSWS